MPVDCSCGVIAQARCSTCERPFCPSHGVVQAPGRIFCTEHEPPPPGPPVCNTDGCGKAGTGRCWACQQTPCEEHFVWDHENNEFDPRGPGPAHRRCLPCERARNAHYAAKAKEQAEADRLSHQIKVKARGEYEMQFRPLLEPGGFAEAAIAVLARLERAGWPGSEMLELPSSRIFGRSKNLSGFLLLRRAGGGDAGGRERNSLWSLTFLTADGRIAVQTSSAHVGPSWVVADLPNRASDELAAGLLGLMSKNPPPPASA